MKKRQRLLGYFTCDSRSQGWWHWPPACCYTMGPSSGNQPQFYLEIRGRCRSWCPSPLEPRPLCHDCCPLKSQFLASATRRRHQVNSPRENFQNRELYWKQINLLKLSNKSENYAASKIAKYSNGCIFWMTFDWKLNFKLENYKVGSWSDGP